MTPSPSDGLGFSRPPRRVAILNREKWALLESFAARSRYGSRKRERSTRDTHRGEARGLPSRTRDALREFGTLVLLETVHTANAAEVNQRFVLAECLARF